MVPQALREVRVLFFFTWLCYQVPIVDEPCYGPYGVYSGYQRFSMYIVVVPFEKKDYKL